MKIAVVSDVIYPWVKGGAERRYYEIYSRLAKKHEVHYFTMLYPGMEREFTHEGMKIHAICRAPDKLYIGQRRKIGPAIKFTLFLLFALFRYSFHVIDSNEFPHLPNIAVRIYCIFRRSTKFTSTWHEFWSQEYWQYYLGFLRGILGFAIQAISLKMSHRIIAVSDHTKNLILSSNLVSPEKVSVVCNGIDPNLINEAKRLRKPTVNTIVTVGRLIPEKRVDLLIEVVKRLLKTNPDIRLRIVGDGPEKEWLIVLGEPIQAEFLGFIEDHLDVLIEVASSSVFISMSEREGFNISALEACELGVPTFARSGWFDHPNLHRMIPASMREILHYLPKTPVPPTQVSNQFIWNRIVAQMEEALV